MSDGARGFPTQWGALSTAWVMKRRMRLQEEANQPAPAPPFGSKNVKPLRNIHEDEPIHAGFATAWTTRCAPAVRDARPPGSLRAHHLAAPRHLRYHWARRLQDVHVACA